MSDDHEHGGHGHEGHGHSESPHEPAERQRFEPPAGAMVVRGVAMAGAATALGALGLRTAKIGPAGAVIGMTLAVAAALLAWASAIHLTGGEKYDDHPWV